MIVKSFGERIDVFRLLPPAQLDGAPGVIERLLGVSEVRVVGGGVEPRQVVVGRGHVRVEPQSQLIVGDSFLVKFQLRADVSQRFLALGILRGRLYDGLEQLA